MYSGVNTKSTQVVSGARVEERSVENTFNKLYTSGTLRTLRVHYMHRKVCLHRNGHNPAGNLCPK